MHCTTDKHTLVQYFNPEPYNLILMIVQSAKDVLLYTVKLTDSTQKLGDSTYKMEGDSSV